LSNRKADMKLFLDVVEIEKQKNNQPIVVPTSFQLNQHHKLAFIGETGSGKSTLLKMIAGWEEPSAGNAYFKEIPVWKKLEKLLPGEKGIAYLSQHFELRNNYTVTEIVHFDNKLSIDEADKIYRICDIEHLLKRKTHELSGGEKQRIAIARLLIGKPELLILDEPYTNLDKFHKKQMQDLIDAICYQLGITCLLVSHDAADILSWAHEIYVMQNGAIVQKGNPETIYNYPQNEYVAGLLGSYTVIPNSWLNNKTNDTASSIVRPEKIKLQKLNNEVSRIGRITKQKYLGYGYEYSLICNKVNIIAFNTKPDFVVGEEVHVLFDL
ncbi:MAG: ABC transporter ATP-binding protein, partial [Chitinophagaceae bacterium]